MSLATRILFSAGTHKPPASPLLGNPRLSAALLDLFALILREHVPFPKDPDKDFANAVLAVLVHVTAALEARVKSADLPELLLVTVPAVLERHIKAVDAADKVAHDSDGLVTFSQAYRALVPHLALQDPTTTRPDDTYLRAVVDGILAHVLPVTDYASDAERTLVTEIVAGTIMQGALFNLVAQPWFLHQVIAKQLEAHHWRSTSSISEADESVHTTSSPLDSGKPSTMVDRLRALYFVARALLISVAALVRTILARPPPAHYLPSALLRPSLSLSLVILPPSLLLTQLSTFLSAVLVLFAPFFASLTLYLLRTRLFRPELLEKTLKSAIGALFPGGHPPPKQPEPTREEQELLRIRAERAIAASIHPRLIQVLFPVTTTPHRPESLDHRRLTLARSILRGIERHEANVGLFLELLDEIVKVLVPEMVEEDS